VVDILILDIFLPGKDFFAFEHDLRINLFINWERLGRNKEVA
jgi:hypothetical protein